MTDSVIKVEGLGKRYRLRHKTGPRYRSLREDLAAGLRRIALPGRANPRFEGAGGDEDFWALRDVSFEVKQGEVIGIIGRNGAGKSTALKILSRITEPTEGRVRIKGRVASLLEVGTGFHPELTGRENIFLNGVILGMTRAEVRRRFDEIAAFAEVERFLDTPVKFYSSGMYVRLAFSVAAHLDPEILIVDEVLAVGDAEFQRKCLGKMHAASAGGRTVIFVSHQMQAVRQLCGRAILFDRGRVALEGRCEKVIGQYLQGQEYSNSLRALSHTIQGLPADPGFRLTQVDVRQDGKSTTDLVTGKPVEICLAYEVLQDAHGLHVYFMLYDLDESLIFDSLHNGDEEHMPHVVRGRYESIATIPADFLAGRSYDLQIMAGIQGLRAFFPEPLRIGLRVHATGIVNRAYSGYSTSGKIAPLIPWRTDKLG